MLKGLGDIGMLMKLQKDYKSMQKKIAGAALTGNSPDGSVRATMTGDYRIKEIRIDPDFFKGTDVRELEKMVCEAVNSASSSVKQFTTDEMEKIAGGLNIPGLGNLFK
jgi:hypothetical protein